MSFPPGWHESVTGEKTTFRFHAASNLRRAALTIVLAPLPLLALSMTAASIREANWGLGYLCVGGFDLLALAMVLLIVQQYNRTLIVFESGHVTWDDGPFLRTRTRMTYAEAATLGTRMHTTRNTPYFTFTLTRDGTPRSLGTTLEDQTRVSFVLGRIDDELRRRAGLAID